MYKAFLIGFDIVTLDYSRFDRLDGIWAKVVKADHHMGGKDNMPYIDLSVEAWPHKSYRQNIADGIMLADGISSVLPLVGVIADGTFIVDARMGDLTVPITDELALVDSLSPIFVGNPSVDDSVAAVDARIFGLDFYAERETINFTDLVQEITAANFGLDDFGSSEFGSPTAFVIADTEVPSIVDAQTVVMDMIASTETPVIADEIAQLLLGTGFGYMSFDANNFGA